MRVEIATNHNRAEQIKVKIIAMIVVAIQQCTESSRARELCHRTIGVVNGEPFKLLQSIGPAKIA